MAQSQSPPPAVWSGNPRKVEAEPSCLTRKALQPAGTPIGAMTKDWPNWSVLMLGSAALLLPWRRRLGLKVAVGGAEAAAGPGATIEIPLINAVAATNAITCPPRCAIVPPSTACRGQAQLCRHKQGWQVIPLRRTAKLGTW